MSLSQRVPLNLRDLPDPQRAKPCVLVVDDDVSVTDLIALRLGPDFRVVGVNDPLQAVATAASEQPGLILCDIDMPGLRGDEVAFALSQDPDTAFIPLVYLTGLVDSGDTSDLDGVFGDYTAIAKSAPADELRAQVAQALGLERDG
jgi:putative two-component system response regulator